MNTKTKQILAASLSAAIGSGIGNLNKAIVVDVVDVQLYGQIIGLAIGGIVAVIVYFSMNKLIASKLNVSELGK